MIQIPDFVFKYLIENKYIGKTRTLIIGENYPNPNFAISYFYRSLPGCPEEAAGITPAFLNKLCNCLMIPIVDHLNIPLTELQRLKYFLNNGFLLIDAQKNGIQPNRNFPILEQNDLENLIYSILLLNPENIMFLTNNNEGVIEQINNHPIGLEKITPKIIENPITHRQVFAFPSPPANPNHFSNQINILRAGEFNI